MASYCQPLPRSRCMVWLGAIATATIAARVPRAREFTLSDVGEFAVPSATSWRAARAGDSVDRAHVRYRRPAVGVGSASR